MQIQLWAALALSIPLLVAPPRAPQDPAPALADDGRVATVADRQGTAAVRPVGRERWTPLRQRSVLLPGDLVRTQDRGAHALELALVKGGSVVLGPDSLLELLAGDAVRLLRGEAEVKGAPGTPLQCQGPGGFARAVTGAIVVRAGERATTVLDAAPRWLGGYRASTTSEWMGSLLAQVDGRDVPLTVGYHSVDAVIRDQVAQTTVEQSFVNSTGARLEGTFFFPLPADASISGFGMWIGDELVEADIVEKQRARQIYEDILRRKKDPGLLEWAGGNLFKARVFPIEPHAEKRVRIRYTQVLPLAGRTLRYRYALRSELLRQHPLRELRLKVSVASAVPLEALACTTHTVRARHDVQGGTIELDAKGYTPERDFEAIVTLARSDPLTAVAHRRGGDGYLGVWLTPPGEAPGPWQRELLPEGKALDVLVLADTSGSMDAPARAQQRALLAALLGLLGAQDRFRLLACDLAPRWLEETARPATADNARQALDKLDARRSLGWTDIDAALAEVARHAGDGTLVVYLGDGIHTSGDCDPVALARRVDQLDARGARWHAVSCGATYEQPVLDAIARHGGTVRAAGDDPAETAFQLLAEAAQPGIEDLRVEVRGVRTARLYPDPLPRLAAGRQQIVLGRFLPDPGQDLSAEVVVSGTRAGQPVRFVAPLALEATEQGNTFLPRLWARRHLDALLAKGTSPEVQAEIVAFSQDYGILTPFTSLLVLENDEDRERYGVQRRVHMRDGEVLFAQGRDQAATAVLRQQMQQARAWRLALRAQMLREIARLGKDLHGWHVAVGGPSTPGSAHYDRGGDSGRLGELAAGEALGLRSEAGDDAFFLGRAERERAQEVEELDAIAPAESPALLDQEQNEKRKDAKLEDLRDYDESEVLGKFVPYGGRPAARAGRAWRGLREAEPGSGLQAFGFPTLAVQPPAVRAPLPDPGIEPEASTILRSLDRRPRLAALSGGLALAAEQTGLDPLTLDVTWRRVAEGLVASAAFWVRRGGHGQEPSEEWLAGGKRGIAAMARRLGRERPALDGDVRAFAFPLADSSLEDLTLTYRGFRARVTGRAGAVATLVLEAPAPQHTAVELRVDVERRVQLEATHLSAGKVTSRTRCLDFVEVEGQVFARTVETFDDRGLLTARTRLDVRAVDAGALERALADKRAAHASLLLAGAEDPDLEASRRALRLGAPSWLERLRVAAWFQGSAQHDRAWQAFAGVEAAAASQPGGPWLRARLLSSTRRGEELRGHATQLATGLVERPVDEASFLAAELVELGKGVLAAGELLTLHLATRAACERDGDDEAFRQRAWQRRHAALLDQAGRTEEALAAHEALVKAWPHDDGVLVEALDAHFRHGRHERATELAQVRVADGKPHDAVFTRWTTALWDKRQLGALLATLERWLATEPREEDPYVRWLSALVYAEREADAARWIDQRLTEASDLREAAPRARLGAALQLALGGGWGLWATSVDEHWHGRLAALGQRLLAQADAESHLAHRILWDWRFRRTKAWADLQQALLATLTAEGALDRLDPLVLERTVAALSWGRGQVDDAAFAAVVKGLERRWRSAGASDVGRLLADRLLAVLDAHGERAQALSVARQRLADTPAWLRATWAEDLLRRLAEEKWSQALEAEMLALWPSVKPAEGTPESQRAAAANALRWLADQLLRLRVAAALGPVEALEKLPRAERQLRTRAARDAARVALAAALAAVPGDPLTGPWLELERLCLAVPGAEDEAAVEARARALLAAVPDDDEALHRVLRERAALVLACAATAKGAPPGLADRVLELLRAERRERPKRLDWSYQLFRLLVALDRPQALEAELRAWIAAPEVESRYRVALGYLIAELGRLHEAVPAFELVAAEGELGPDEHQALAQWHLALGQEAARAQAQLGRFRAMHLHELSNLLHQVYRRTQRQGQGVPAPLEAEDLLALRALLGKAPEPAQQLWLLRELYAPAKDVRVLECLADGVLGHSPQGAYPFLAECKRLLDGVHEEATCDVLVQRLTELEALPATATDHRGLGLLAALVEHRAGQVRNEPGPHLARGVAALERALGQQLEPGEALPLAGLLAEIGAFGDRRYGDAQIAVLERMHATAEPGLPDRLRFATCLTRVRWAYGEHAAAIDGLTAALREHEGRQGTLPPAANEPAAILVQWLLETRAFAVAERLATEQLGKQTLLEQRAFWEDRLHETWVECVENGGAVALGEGEAAYRGARARLQQAMLTCGGDRIDAVAQRYVALHEAAAQRLHLRAAGDDLVRFGAEVLPEVLTRMATGQANVVQRVAGALAELAGPLAALELLVAAAEREQTFWQRLRLDLWRRTGWDMAQYRAKAGSLGALEPRLLTLVTRALERDLLELEGNVQGFYHRRYAGFWSEKAADFAAVARRVLAQRQDSEEHLLYAARYLWHGLDLHGEAIDVLALADERARLREDGRWQLAQWLVEQRRFAQALPHLERLAATDPDTLDYRCQLLRALHGLGRDDDAGRAADAAQQRWESQQRWLEQQAAQLAAACLDAGLLARSAAWFDAAIAMRQRRRSGGADGTIAHWSGEAAKAYVGLGKIEEAVDRASAAVVAQGPRQDQRQHATSALRSVLEGIPDLKAFVARRDAQAAETGLDAPVLRKLLGLIWLDRGDAERAIGQLTLARELSPLDAEVHSALLRAFDAKGDRAGALDALRGSIALAPRELALYPELAERLAALGDAEGEERAFTTVVEVLPQEAEGHRLLAQRREAQHRFADAVVQWQQVVRVRRDEPDGWLCLAQAQQRAGLPDAARRTLEHVLAGTWEERFGDVKAKAAAALGQLPSGAPR